MSEKIIKLEIVPGGWISRPVEAQKTGTWRTFRPVVDEIKCIGCGICEMYCPEASIEIIEQKAKINYLYCKGCGVCANECPQDAIEMIPEIEAREKSQ
jgi:pyruvate ferredoxin oxidoreductase delta subunit